MAEPARSCVVFVGLAPAKPCAAAIPKHDLVVSWKNVIAGSGSTSLKYVAPGKWRSECSNELLYSLDDCDGTLLFKSPTS